MKRILTAIILCVLIGVVIFIGTKIANQGMNMVSEADSQNASTTMLLVQAKLKVISEKAIIDDSKDGYLGEKYSDTSIPYIEDFKTMGIINEDEEEYQDYYVWNQQILDDLGTHIELSENEYYIVNYSNNEVINTKGIKVGKNIYYKLSDVKKQVVE